MTTTSIIDTNAALARRILDEGYGPGAWHGADFKAATADVTPAAAYARLAADRHNIAEIAVHHAYTVHSVRARLLGQPIEPFPFEGDDWFVVGSARERAWPEIQALVAREHAALVEATGQIASRSPQSPLTPEEQFTLILGITCHAAYHAGQVQLVKKSLGS